MKTLAGAIVIGLVVALEACSKERPSAPPDAELVTAPTTAPAETQPAILSASEGHALVKSSCLSCHSEEMLAQQRLTPMQWSKVVTKMIGWGANLEPSQATPLIMWLAATYGPDAGPYEPAPIDGAAAAAEIAPLPDGPFANGDPARGSALYTDRCSGCHGSTALGHIGVRLVDRPILYRAAELAETVRRGRGKMAPMVMSDAELADVLAHLRSLH